MYFLITIRDPVERFVSAFNWRLVVSCNPDGDDRKAGPGAHNNPGHLCKSKNKNVEEAKILFHRYEKNVNILAEALCSKNEIEKEQAHYDMKEIVHVKHSLSDWIGDSKDDLSRFIPIVLHESIDLNEQIDEAVELAYINNPFESNSSFLIRKKSFQEKNELSWNTSIVERLKHSSTKHKKDFHPLSELGRKCITQYYKEDYKLIRLLKEKACKSSNCTQALQSMLDPISFDD